MDGRVGKAKTVMPTRKIRNKEQRNMFARCLSFSSAMHVDRTFGDDHLQHLILDGTGIILYSRFTVQAPGTVS